MKKLLLLLVGCVVAFAASAQLYVVGPGAIQGDSPWTPDSPVTVQEQNGWYTFELAATGSEFQMSKAKGDWNTFNGSVLGINGSWSGSISDGLQTCSLTQTSANDAHKFTAPEGFKYVRVSSNFSKMEWSDKAFSNGGGDDTNFKTFYLIGKFNDWTLADVNYRFKTEDGKIYTLTTSAELAKGSGNDAGFKINEGNWDAGSIVFGDAGQSVVGTTFNLGQGGNIELTIPANATITLTYNEGGTSTLLIEEKVADTYTYFLYQTNGTELGQFTGNPYEFTYNIATPLAADTPLCVRRVKNDTEATDYTLSSALVYDGTNGSEKALQEGNANNLSLKKALKGAVNFVLNVSDNIPATLNISGGEIETPVFKRFHLIGKFNEWAQSDYTYEFATEDGITYTLTLETELKQIGNGLKVKEVGVANWFGVDANTQCAFNKTIELNGDGNLTFSKDIPKGAVITFKYDASNHNKSTFLIETNNGDDKPVDAIYMHFKYDLSEYGAANAVPYCQYYNTGNSDKSDVKTMTLESDRYSIWKAPLSEDEATKYNAVKFWFAKNNGTANYDSYRDSGNEVVSYFDADNWTKYIYATSSRSHNNVGNYEYAVQSYISYADFKALDQLDINNGGRRNLYLVGWGKSDNKPFKYYDDNNTEQTMPAGVANALKLNEDGGCFYLTILPDGGSFKISWLSVADAIANLPDGYNKTDSQREWATYDLGLIGVDKDHNYPSDEFKPNYNRNEGVNGKVYFVRNRSVRYMNYNQADWVLPDNTDELPGVGRKRWLVVDTHCSYDENGDIDEANSCKTVTITSFDPNPSVEVEVSGVQARQEPLDDEVAKSMHHDCLYGAKANGHIYMKNVNYAVADVKINATNIADVANSNFSRLYTLYVNDHPVGTHSGTNLENLHIDYFPLSYDESGNSMSVRAKYTDSNTTLSFHSRTGKGTVNADVTFKAPEEEMLTGRYIYEGDAEDGKQIYGVYVEGLDFQVTGNEYNVYSDFKFDRGSEARFVDSNHPIHAALNDVVPAWGDWSVGQDWSSKLMADRELAPVFIHNVVRVADFSDLIALDDKEITCTLYAVYPFMYNPDATFTVNASPANAPAKAAGDGITDFTGFKVFNTTVPTSFSFKVNADNAISGVADVIAEGGNEAEAVYYTISGIRVNGDPAPGIYVRVRGDKVEKVVVR